MNESVVLQVAKSTAYEPSLWYLWLFFIASYPLFTWAFKSRNVRWGNFWYTWIIVVVLSGLFTLFLSNSPNYIVEFTTKCKEFLGF